MIVTENILQKARKHGVRVDWFMGKPRISGYEYMTNNYRKMHGLPMARWKTKKEKGIERLGKAVYMAMKEAFERCDSEI